MCQLLAMNCNTPTDIVFSFEGFRTRGGLTDHHTDGFGIAFFERNGVRLFQDDAACARSPVADLVRAYPIRSMNVLAHIRKATQGQTALANTHPFMREMWGQYWVFAHNGNVRTDSLPAPTFYRPVGDTDSEKIFCFLLNRLREKFPDGADAETLFAEIAALCRTVRRLGLLNFVLSNGQWLIAHCGSLLHYIVREAPFGEAKLLDDDVSVDFSTLTSSDDRVAVIATLPLTENEKWQQLAVDELVLFRDGRVLLRDAPPNPHYPTREEGLAMAARAAEI